MRLQTGRVRCGVGRGLKADGLVTSFSLLCQDRLEKPELPYATHTPTWSNTHTHLMTHGAPWQPHQQLDNHSHHIDWSTAQRQSPSHSLTENVPVFQLHLTKFFRIYFTEWKSPTESLMLCMTMHCSETLSDCVITLYSCCWQMLSYQNDLQMYFACIGGNNLISKGTSVVRYKLLLQNKNNILDILETA